MKIQRKVQPKSNQDLLVRLLIENLLLSFSNHLKLRIMSNELDQLTADVARNTDVSESAIVLLQGLKAKLDAAGTDPVKLQELSASLQSESQKLSDAVVANTPAA